MASQLRMLCNMMQKKPKIGVLGRSGGNPKRGKVLINLGRMLKDDFELDLIINSRKVNPELEKYYNIVNYSSLKINKSDYIKLLINDKLNLFRYIRRNEPDLIFQYTHPFVQGPVVAVIGKITGTPTITRFSGSSFEMHKTSRGLKAKISAYFNFKLFMKLMFWADRVIVLGESQKREAVANGCNLKKIIVLPQPIDEKKFHPPKSRAAARKRLGFEADKKYVLWVGNLKKYKGLETLTSAIRNVNSRSDEFYFYIIGKDYENISEKLKKLGSNVKVVGEVLHKDMVKYYQAADLLIHTSFVEASVPNTIWEAAACGTPSIGRDIRDTRKIADVTFGNDDELADLILNGKWKFSKKSKVPMEYAWVKLKEKYKKTFKELCRLHR